MTTGSKQNKARLALDRVKVQFDLLRSSKTLAEFEENWREYLQRLERVWHKANDQYRRSPSWRGWMGKYKTLRDQDPLLRYLTNARNADEHSIQDITKQLPGGVGIRPAEGNVLIVKEMRIENGKWWINSPSPITIVFSPAKTRLLPVENRGVRYPVPDLHLGSALNSNNVIEIAERGLSFYENFLVEAEAKFDNQNRSILPRK